MSEKTNAINWYPGHMAKARRQMAEQLKLVDIIVELRDARIPEASANPILGELSANKPVLIVLNKADLADEKQNLLWKEHYEHCLLADSSCGSLTRPFVNMVQDILRDKLERAKARGIRKKVLRAMVVGIPNVGKSTFINNIVRKKAAKAENRPGVTRSLQWIRINEDVELLDTPGVLWPKIENHEDAVLLGLIGSINDDVLDREELVLFALDYLKERYPGIINARYDVSEDSNDLLGDIARNRGWLEADGLINKTRAIDMLLKDFRSERIGRISWQHAGE